MNKVEYLYSVSSGMLSTIIETLISTYNEQSENI